VVEKQADPRTPSPYRERILDHFQNPRHRGRLEAPDLVGEADNPVCGDAVRLELRLDRGRVAEAAFEGEGCVISLAAASMLTEHIHGRSLVDLRQLTEGDMLAMLGVDLGRVRSQCALVALRALEAALHTRGD
jgi:nitrogen fixation NifU-like protein